MHLPSGSPLALLEASVEAGGLGVPQVKWEALVAGYRRMFVVYNHEVEWLRMRLQTYLVQALRSLGVCP